MAERTVKIKRVYEAPDDEDGTRILIDRLWPRGLSKEKVRIDFWAKDCSPSHDLRRWYGHDPKKWSEFQARYFAELDARPEALKTLEEHLQSERITLVFSSKELVLNNATAFKEYLEAIDKKKSGHPKKESR